MFYVDIKIIAFSFLFKLILVYYNSLSFWNTTCCMLIMSLSYNTYMKSSWSCNIWCVLFTAYKIRSPFGLNVFFSHVVVIVALQVKFCQPPLQVQCLCVHTKICVSTDFVVLLLTVSWRGLHVKWSVNLILIGH